MHAHRSSFDDKAAGVYYWCFVDLTLINYCPRRTFAAPFNERIQVLFFTLSLNADTPVLLISNETFDAQLVSLCFRGGSEENTLHHAANLDRQMFFHLILMNAGRETTFWFASRRIPLKNIIGAEECRLAVPDDGADHLFI